jgi:hypothetical protein
MRAQNSERTSPAWPLNALNVNPAAGALSFPGLLSLSSSFSVITLTTATVLATVIVVVATVLIAATVFINIVMVIVKLIVVATPNLLERTRLSVLVSKGAETVSASHAQTIR